MRSGNIIEFIDDGNIIMGYILAVESVTAAGRRKENYRVVTEKNKIINITASKIINCESSNISERNDHAQIASRLIEMRDRRRLLASNVPLCEMRELIMLEPDGLFKAREIAAAYYGNTVSNDEISAVTRNLFTKNPYFKRKEDYFFPASDEDISKFIAQQEKDALNKKLEEDFARDIEALEAADYSPEACSRFIEAHRQKIELLKNSIIFDDEAAQTAKARELQQKISVLVNRKVEIFDFLVKLKIFSKHENLAVNRYNIKKEFKDSIMAAAVELSQKDFMSGVKLVEPGAFFDVITAGAGAVNAAATGRDIDISLAAGAESNSDCFGANGAFKSAAALDALFDFGGGARLDLRLVPCITIDSRYTLCYDDAIGFCDHAGYKILLVHVSDAAEYIAEGGVLDSEAYRRASAVYLAEGKIDMLPQALSNGLMSLNEGEDRLAVSLIAVCAAGAAGADGVDKTDETDRTDGIDEADGAGAAKIIKWFFVPSVVRVSKKCFYDQIDELYEKLASGCDINDLPATRCFGAEGYKMILDIAIGCRNGRIARGAPELSFPKSEVFVEKFDEDEPIVKLLSEKRASSAIIVSEYMVLYNSLSAALIAASGAAACFKSSKTYPQPELIDNYRKALAETNQTYDAAAAWVIRRSMNFAETSYSPSAHGMLGVACYIQSSSPLRRYIDLANQRQLKAISANRPPCYDLERIKELSMYLDATLSSVSEAEQESHYYWLYMYLRQNAGSVYEGVVIEASEERARIEIEKVYLHVTAQARVHGRFTAGERVAVTIENANARERKLFFKAVKIEV